MGVFNDFSFSNTGFFNFFTFYYFQKQNRKVIVIDGDGSTIMHMGSLAIIGDQNIDNLKHIIINNGSHESVGGQPTVGFKIYFEEITKSCRYKQTYRIKTKEELLQILPMFLKNNSLELLEVFVKKGSRKGLGRPKTTPIENKKYFMNYLGRK